MGPDTQCHRCSGCGHMARNCATEPKKGRATTTKAGRRTRARARATSTKERVRPQGLPGHLLELREGRAQGERVRRAEACVRGSGGHGEEADVLERVDCRETVNTMLKHVEVLLGQQHQQAFFSSVAFSCVTFSAVGHDG